jgi:hypothetical protein
MRLREIMTWYKSKKIESAEEHSHETLVSLTASHDAQDRRTVVQ